MDKAEEVQALHGWKAKEIHRKKASKKKTVATGPAAEFGTICKDSTGIDTINFKLQWIRYWWHEGTAYGRYPP